MSCTKIRYRDRIAALGVLARIQHRDSVRRERTETRAYPCRRCRGWHLTSKG